MTKLLTLLAVAVLAGCSSGEEHNTFVEGGVSLEVPSVWDVSGFSVTVFPRRLVAASYEVRRADVEGDCGGYAAVERLPRRGAYVVLIDYGARSGPAHTSDFPSRLPLALKDGQLANFECFGHSYAFRFIVNGRAIQAHVGLGRDADNARRSEALRVVNSLRIVG